MRHDSLDQFLSTHSGLLAKGPVALIFLEDRVEVDSTLRHTLSRGFAQVLAFSRQGIEIAPDIAPRVHHITLDMMADHPVPTTVNRIIEEAPGTWLHYGFNGEYLFHPFCEARTVGEMIAFVNEERRDSILCFVVDLYAGDLETNPNAVSLDDAWLDRTGYYALARTDEWDNPIDRQMDFFGGLRWRFEELIPESRRRIDRVALFKAKPGLKLLPDHRMTDPEYNTYSCPWHHSPTAAVASFRSAKALKRNPGSSFDIQQFRWRNSAPFSWSSQQLLDLGLMEPGQWF
ncbi:MAG: hypothetical protein CSA72_11600 [Rhodobacterales bacterium]|nr:MAG: hypothetical protein CSA72_11600 [Rhodobacterales bacterium]